MYSAVASMGGGAHSESRNCSPENRASSGSSGARSSVLRPYTAVGQAAAQARRAPP